MKNNKDTWMKQLTNEEDKKFLAKLYDKIYIVEKAKKLVITDFIDPKLQILASKVLSQNTEIKWDVSGGDDSSERKRIVICPEYFELEDDDYQITLLALEGKITNKFTHRDYLGALLGTGIKREKIGDIWVTPKGCVVAADRDIATYIMQQSLRIKDVELDIQEISYQNFEPPAPKEKIINTTVSSLRLDAIAAAGFGISRTNILKDISAGKVKVNWNEGVKANHILNVSDVISARGRGRVILEEVSGESKKGRIWITLKRLI